MANQNKSGSSRRPRMSDQIVSSAQYAGNIIRQQRLEKKISQQELATVLGVGRTAIANWESGKARPDFETIVLLCKTLDIPVGVLFGVPDESTLSETEQEHIHLLRQLDPYHQNSVATLMRSLIENNYQAFRDHCFRDYIRLDHMADKVCAGSGTPLENSHEHDSMFVRKTEKAEKADVIITVTGDSMEPTYCDGDDLLVEYTEMLRPGEIGIFVVAGEGTVKEYRQDGLHPHNPEHKVIHPNEDDNMRCIGRVLGKVDKEMRASNEELKVLEQAPSGAL